MDRVKTVNEMFYHVEDVMTMLGYSRSHSYKIIADLNAELKAKGFCTRDGKISRRYFDQRYGLVEPEAKAGRRALA